MKNFFLCIGVCLFVVFMSCGAHAELVSHFTFDNTLEDAASDNDGTFVGGDVLYTQGFDGNPTGAVVFDGSNDYVDVAQNTNLPLSGSEAFSVAMWVKGPVQRDKRIFSEGSSASNTPLYNLGTHNQGSNGAFDFFLRADTGTVVNHAKSPQMVYDDTWHHIAWIDDNGSCILYIDGVRSWELNYGRRPLTVNTTTIGGILRGSSCCHYAGAIDDVRLYNHALSREEVEAIIPSFSGCGDADTHCSGIDVVDAPIGNVPGFYTLEPQTVDDTADAPLFFYVIVEDSESNVVLETAPLEGPQIELKLGEGIWTVRTLVRDDIFCGDDANDSTCETTIEITNPPQLVSHWPFDGDLLDQEISANHGTFVGNVAPTFTEGFDGTPDGAISLDGIDDYVDVLQNRLLPIYDNGAYTVTMWVKSPVDEEEQPINQTDRRIFAEASTVSGTPLLNLGTDNTGNSGAFAPYIRTNTNQAVLGHPKSAREPFDGTWHHIAWVDDNGAAILYIDGIRDATDYTYTPSTLTLNTTSIGGILRAAPSHWFQGAIDEVKLFNYALTQEEVEELVPERADCPGDADTHCAGLEITGPEDETAGTYTATATGDDETTDDPLYFTFVATNPDGARVQVGPATNNQAEFDLAAGIWTIAVTVDDDLGCRDVAEDATCETTFEVLTEPKLMVAHLPFDGDLLDATGSGNDGTYTLAGDPPFVQGIDCNPTGAMSFDGDSTGGAGGVVLVTQADRLPVSTRETFSIAMWVKGDVQRDKRVFSESTRANRNSLFNIGTHNTAANGVVDIFIRGASTAFGGHKYSDGIAFDGTWHHIVWTDENGAAKLYIDGVQDTADFTYTRVNFQAPLDITSIGGIVRPKSPPGDVSDDLCCVFDGSIDDVMLFNYIIDEDQITALYGEGPSDCCPEEGDTTCDGVVVNGPAGNAPGTYTVVATAFDVSGDDIIYTFTADNGTDAPVVIGPQAGNTADFTLTEGSWDMTIVVDDDPDCPDEHPDNTCTTSVEVCPGDGDTTCSSLEVTGPDDNAPGTYTATTNATDDSGDDIIYTFTADNGIDDPIVIGPQAGNTADFDLAEGSWDISVVVDDDPDCLDEAVDNTCSTQVDVCPADGDTTCDVIEIVGPAGDIPGTYTVTVTAADASGDAISYTITADNGVDDPLVAGPQTENSTTFDLTEGDWTISATVDDDPECTDEAGTCSTDFTVNPPGIGPFLRGDDNNDGDVNISDPQFSLNWQFLGGPEPECLAALDTNQDGDVNISDPQYSLNYQFLGGPAPPLPFPDCGLSNDEGDKALGCDNSSCP